MGRNVEWVKVTLQFQEYLEHNNPDRSEDDTSAAEYTKRMLSNASN
jgi:hypothetical protein